MTNSISAKAFAHGMTHADHQTNETSHLPPGQAKKVNNEFFEHLKSHAHGRKGEHGGKPTRPDQDPTTPDSASTTPDPDKTTP